MTTPRDAFRGLFHSRVGRRALGLFAGCAVIPTTILAGWSLHSVSSRLDVAAEAELHRAAKSVGMGVAERLQALSEDLALAETLLAPVASEAADALGRILAGRFRAIAVVDAGRSVALLGAPSEAPSVATTDLERLDSGRSLVKTRGACVFVLRRLADGRLLRAEPTDEALWGTEAARLPIGATWILTADGQPLFGDTDRPPPEVAGGVAGEDLAFTAGDGSRWVGRARELFLVPALGVRWTVVHARPRQLVQAPLRLFQGIYVSTLVLALVAVLGISVVQIRRTLEPIERLRNATRRIAAGDLAVRVGFDRRDEFGELARSFDRMTERLVENIRRREATERDLVRARDEALAAMRTEAAFLTNVSHEFRTPLTGIQGSAEILRDFVDEPAEVRQEFVATIVEQAAHLARLVDDVLAMSGLGSSKLEPDAEPVALLPSLLAAIATLPPAAIERVEVEADDEDVAVTGAGRWLESLWRRLLDNACKFSGDVVRVTVRRGEDEVVVAITDRGCGIAAEDHAAIFERFRQVGRDQLTDKAGGTGLGLALAREIARQHGGRIEVESALGAGATFRVALPCRVPEPAVLG